MAISWESIVPEIVKEANLYPRRRGAEIMVVDYQFKYQVANRPGGEGLLVCFSCGICTAGCPVAEVEEGLIPAYNSPGAFREKGGFAVKFIWMCVDVSLLPIALKM